MSVPDEWSSRGVRPPRTEPGLQAGWHFWPSHKGLTARSWSCGAVGVPRNVPLNRWPDLDRDFIAIEASPLVENVANGELDVELASGESGAGERPDCPR